MVLPGMVSTQAPVLCSVVLFTFFDRIASSCRHLDNPEEPALKGSDEEAARSAPDASETAGTVSSSAQAVDSDDGDRDK